MNDDLGFERTAAEWLDTGSDTTPPDVINAVLLAVSVTPQERDLRVPWRTSPMTAYLRVAAVIAIVAVAGVAAFYATNGGPGIGSGPDSSPTMSPTAEPTATTAIPTPDPLDTANWETFASSQYRFTIGHPPDWEVRPSTRAWDLDTDAADWLSPAMDNFINPSGDVRVSVWSVALQAKYADDSDWGINLEAWIEDYCESTNSTSCDRMLDGAVPLCREAWDCHPGMLVRLPGEVQAFFSGPDNDEITVVTVWRRQTDPRVVRYGGGQSLVEAFLSTMDVWTAEAAEIQRSEVSP